MLGDQSESAQARQDEGNVLQLEVKVFAFDEARTHHGDQANQEQKTAHQQGKQAGPRATELACRVTQRRKAKGQGNRHEEQAPDKVSVIHMKSDEVGGKVRRNKQPHELTKRFVDRGRNASDSFQWAPAVA